MDQHESGVFSAVCVCARADVTHTTGQCGAATRGRVLVQWQEALEKLESTSQAKGKPDGITTSFLRDDDTDHSTTADTLQEKNTNLSRSHRRRHEIKTL